VPENVLEAALVERIKRAIREDLLQSSLTTAGVGHNGGPPLDPPVYDVPEFCHAHRISRSTLYALWHEGLGPKFFKAGVAIRISREAAATWRAEREAATDQRFGHKGEAA
jgi:hypothetical protein